MIRFERVSKAFGAQVILSQADWEINPGERIGLIGANGVGKTTLLRLILGELEADAGTIARHSHQRLGVVRQEILASDRSLIEETLCGHEELVRLRQQRQQLRQHLTDHSSDQTALARLGEVDCRLETLGTYDAEARAGAILLGLGFSNAALTQPVTTCSGGWRMRLALAQALFAQPDLLLLDEPTNHLDLESVTWLEYHLAQWPKTLILISHNRSFLDRTVTTLMELEAGQLSRYPAPFEHYVARKAERLRGLVKAAAEQQRRMAALERFIDRFRAKATKARQVQSRIKMLGRMELIEASEPQRQPPRIQLPVPGPCPRELCTLHQASCRYDDRTVLANVNLNLLRGDKIGLLGVNGAGKSTLLKLCAGLLTAASGRVMYGAGVRPAWFAQHALETLVPQDSVLASAEAAQPTATRASVRQLLGSFLFSGDEVFKSVAVLSGGERARLALVRLFLSGANLLLLDEPTNHLDMEARTALTDALEAYQGTFILISHDRDLLESVCSHYWLVADGRVQVWEQGLDAYLEQSLLQRNNRDTAPVTATSGNRRDLRRQTAELRERLARETAVLRQQRQLLEQQITQMEKEQAQLDQWLAAPERYQDNNKELLTAQLIRHQQLAFALEQALASWEQVSRTIEAHEQQTQEALEALSNSSIVSANGSPTTPL
ncbi:MAG: ABC-F family ATP-binding cassette domain-containing protein [Magnetococcales bacterium]|nr:ABC-F family ATP-binding cassette domain-containing protein [Magnetococcales bacterium]